MAYKKGHKKLGGRKKGTPNKFTTFKAAIEESFADAGGAAYLLAVSKSDPSAYLAFAKSVIPKQTEISGNLTLNVDYRSKLEAARIRARKD